MFYGQLEVLSNQGKSKGDDKEIVALEKGSRNEQQQGMPPEEPFVSAHRGSGVLLSVLLALLGGSPRLHPGDDA